MNAVMPHIPRFGLVVAKTTATPAAGPFVISFFTPFSTYPPVVLSAVVRRLYASDPDSGSVMA